MTMLIVGGTFDKNGGKPSYLVGKMQEFFGCEIQNGGNVNNLYTFRPIGIDILIWMPNIDNSEDKILPRLKTMNPKMLLVSSKRNIKKVYSEYELTTRAINVKANLSIVIYKNTSGYLFSILDPLGNSYCKTEPLALMLPKLQARLSVLQKTKRLPSVQAEFDLEPTKPVLLDFILLVKYYGHRFQDIIQANNPKRFLGNASTRCEWGFPSQRQNNYILVSKRNVNKSDITKNNFVKATMSKSRVIYFGKHKPSVDTPVQLQLYRIFPNINYMIHGHCYIKGAPFTKDRLTCGDLNEVSSIRDVVTNQNSSFIAINLLGHGCIIMSKTINNMHDVELIPRPCLEYIEE